MRNFLETRLGKEIEVQCPGMRLSGKVVKVEGNVLHLAKDDKVSFINIEKIIVISEVSEKKAQPPGFLSKS